MHLRSLPIGDEESSVESLSAAFGAGDEFRDESSLAASSVSRLYRPRSERELAAVLKHCNKRGLVVSVAGGRTGVVGGAVPKDADVVVELKNLQGIKFSQHGARVSVTVGAGVSLRDLNEFLRNEQNTYYFPVNPTESWASLGGMVSTNASGSRSYHYGSVRRWVRRLRVVLMSGSVLEVGRDESSPRNDGTITLEDSGESRSAAVRFIPKPATKNTTGYSFSEITDDVDLFVGSEGTLGVVTEVELDLAPLPGEVFHFLQFFSSEEAALGAIDRFKGLNYPTLSLEYMCSRSLKLFKGSPKSEVSRLTPLVGAASAALHLELDCSGVDVDDLLVELMSVATATSADPELSFAGSDTEVGQEIRAFRHAIPEAVNSTNARRAAAVPGIHKLSTDMAVPDGALVKIYRIYREALERENLEFVIFGHAGDNHLHVNVMARDLAELEKGKELYLNFAREVVKLGGAVSAEHGIGRIKRDFLLIQYDDEILAAMKAIKRIFDPKNLLNRGVLLYD